MGREHLHMIMVENQSSDSSGYVGILIIDVWFVIGQQVSKHIYCVYINLAVVHCMSSESSFPQWLLLKTTQNIRKFSVSGLVYLESVSAFN